MGEDYLPNLGPSPVVEFAGETRVYLQEFVEKVWKNLIPSFRRKPESRILLISLILISWTPAFAGVTECFSTNR
jgi:hypothetical protein